MNPSAPQITVSPPASAAPDQLASETYRCARARAITRAIADSEELILGVPSPLLLPQPAHPTPRWNQAPRLVSREPSILSASLPRVASVPIALHQSDPARLRVERWLKQVALAHEESQDQVEDPFEEYTEAFLAELEALETAEMEGEEYPAFDVDASDEALKRIIARYEAKFALEQPRPKQAFIAKLEEDAAILARITEHNADRMILVLKRKKQGKRGLSRAQLEEDLQISQQTLAEIESGTCKKPDPVLMMSKASELLNLLNDDPYMRKIRQRKLEVKPTPRRSWRGMFSHLFGRANA
jgi:DNA-binding XRE family transcriptional regulator